jgi:hypothetical protein
MAMPQRRRWDRFRIALDVTIAGDGLGAGLSCKTLDICEGGLGVACPIVLTVGEDYRFAIPGLTEAPLTGTVRWCTPSPAAGGFALGIALEAMSARQSEDVAEAISRWKAQSVRMGDE